MMSRNEEWQQYRQLGPYEKIDSRIAWLEQKLVEVLWLLIGVTSILIGGLVTWFTGELLEAHSPWLLAPVFVIVWLVCGVLLKRMTFRGAPPHIQFLDP
jgi:hypothetical protein